MTVIAITTAVGSSVPARIGTAGLTTHPLHLAYPTNSTITEVDPIHWTGIGVS